MRILVGTLYTTENEYDACVESINRQTHQSFEHFVIKNVPNAEAHDRLYGTFMERASEFDLFVKVDADMVLAGDRVFEGICERFAHEPGMRNLQIAVHDFFTDRLIGGLHAYRSDVRWEKRAGHAFTDVDSLAPEEKAMDWSELAPAAYHCPAPSPFQALHFGLHKGVKVREGIRLRWRSRAWGHVENVELTWAHFQRNPDRRLGLACVGAEMALAGQCDVAGLDYDNPHAEALFAQAAEWDVAKLRRQVRWLRCRRMKGVPVGWWFDVAYDGVWPTLWNSVARNRFTKAADRRVGWLLGR